MSTQQEAAADDAGALTLLQLMWLASPALPVGGYSYSEGLEAAVDRLGLSDGEQVGAWLLDQLHLALARSDLVVLAQAMRAWRDADLERVAQLNAWVLLTRETSEQRQQTEQMGRSLLEWMRHQALATERLDWLNERDPTYPVAFALAASVTPATVRDSLLCFAFGWAENMVQAGVKAVPLGQNAGQRMLRRLSVEIPLAVRHAMTMTDETRQAFCPMLAILGAQHETQYARLFRS